jgi:hypothetical protein
MQKKLLDFGKFDVLPNCLLRNFFRKYLSVPDIVHRISLLNKNFYEYSQNQELWLHKLIDYAWKIPILKKDENKIKVINKILYEIHKNSPELINWKKKYILNYTAKGKFYYSVIMFEYLKIRFQLPNSHPKFLRLNVYSQLKGSISTFLPIFESHDNFFKGIISFAPVKESYYIPKKTAIQCKLINRENKDEYSKQIVFHTNILEYSTPILSFHLQSILSKAQYKRIGKFLHNNENYYILGKEVYTGSSDGHNFSRSTSRGPSLMSNIVQAKYARIENGGGVVKKVTLKFKHTEELLNFFEENVLKFIK